MIGGWRKISDYWSDAFYDEQSIDFGRVVITTKEGKVSSIKLNIDAKAFIANAPPSDDLSRKVISILDGNREELPPLFLAGKTKLQEEVWEALLAIPYGKTWNYSDIAKMVSKPKAVRAIGTIIKLNPCPVLVPCHRVIKKSGEIGNYAYGEEVKRRLLAREGVFL